MCKRAKTESSISLDHDPIQDVTLVYEGVYKMQYNDGRVSVKYDISMT